MANCPVCGQSIQDDFGLVNCNSCGSPVLLGMDGEVGVPEAEPPEFVQQEAEPLYEPPPEPEEVIASEDIPEDSSEDFEELPDIPEMPMSNPADMSDVVDYANSEASNGTEGNLKFNLKISGIDTVDIKKGIQEVLSDSKLHLDPEQTIAKIESGDLFIEGLSAVKCAILVQRLKSLSLEINWEQYAIQQA